jgi:serine/threonine-protein kinase HipA
MARIKKEHFEKLAKELGLNDKQIERVFIRMLNNKPKAIDWIDKSFLSDELKTAYKEVIRNRYAQLSLAE